VIPFRVALKPGQPLHEQLAFAARRAIVGGRLKPGDPFPSVRALSLALKINPNTVHKAVGQLTAEGLLAVMPGIGTVVADARAGTRQERERLLKAEAEILVVEAKRLGLSLEQVKSAVETHWRRLSGNKEEA
jgi:GntR family transcriptional regulator